MATIEENKGLTIVHEFDERGNHRIAYIGTTGARLKESDWVSYQSPATLIHSGVQFVATTDYFGEAITSSSIPQHVAPDEVATREVCRDCGATVRADDAGELVDACAHVRARNDATREAIKGIGGR